MAFREKGAWLSLVSILIAYGAYFGVIGPSIGFGAARLTDVIWAFGAVCAAHATAMIVGSIVLAVQARREATAPGDERDRAIERRGTAIAYYVLISGMILVGIVMPFSSPPYKIVNAALAAIVVAEIVHYVLVLVSYRRGWHG
jgi:hypothetical protein